MQTTPTTNPSSTPVRAKTHSGGLETFSEVTRAPLKVPVRLKFDSFGEMKTGFTANVSRGGMFVGGADPHPVGTLLKFELVLSPGSPPVAGMGEVVWIRLKQTDLKNPRGMGVQFRYLDVESLATLDDAVRNAVVALGVPQAPIARSAETSRRSDKLLRELEQALSRSDGSGSSGDSRGKH